MSEKFPNVDLPKGELGQVQTNQSNSVLTPEDLDRRFSVVSSPVQATPNSILGKVKQIIGIGTLAVAAAVSGAPHDVEAKTVFAVPREYNPELLRSINLDSSAQDFFKENSLSLQVFKNTTNAPGKTAVCILASGIAVMDVCFLEDTAKATLSYDRIKRILSATMVNKDGSQEEYKFLPKFDSGGYVVDFLD